MYVMVVCAGNVARSPALACLLQASRADLRVESAGVGRKAVAGLRMKKPMRGLLAQAGYAEFAQAHRSRLIADLTECPDLCIAVGVSQMRRLEELLPDVPRQACDPLIPDPAYGDQVSYDRAWTQILENAARLAVAL
jgi:protein-tyrosine-phosphatase